MNKFQLGDPKTRLFWHNTTNNWPDVVQEITMNHGMQQVLNTMYVSIHQ